MLMFSQETQTSPAASQRTLGDAREVVPIHLAMPRAMTSTLYQWIHKTCSPKDNQKQAFSNGDSIIFGSAPCMDIPIFCDWRKSPNRLIKLNHPPVLDCALPKPSGGSCATGKSQCSMGQSTSFVQAGSKEQCKQTSTSGSLLKYSRHVPAWLVGEPLAS